MFVAGLLFGPVKINFNQIINILMYYFGIINIDEANFNSIQEMVFVNIRLPRVLLTILVGMGLGTSGAILQGLFRNPLVDPGFIGVSSGAAVGAMLAILFSQIISSFMPILPVKFLLPVLAISGSFLTTFLVYKMSKVLNKTNIMVMLLSGIAINAFSGSIIGLFVNISSDVELRTFTFWTLGGFDNASWDVILISMFCILIPFAIAYRMKDEMDIFMLGDAEAQHLGVNIEFLKKKNIFISSIMVGISVSFCGMIGFIGLVTPHLIRLFIGPNHKYLIPGSAILGAILLGIADLISKTIIAPAQLPVGIITSAIGAPFFVWLILGQKKRISYSE